MQSAELTDLIGSIDRLVTADPEVHADGDSMVELRRQAARLEAMISRSTARFDASRSWESDGAQTAAAWLAWRCRLPRQTARREVSLSRRTRHLPVAQDAWLAGDIHEAHVAKLASVRRSETEVALARDEEMLVDNARTLRFESYVRMVDYWAQRADPDGSEDDDRSRLRRRDVYLTESFGGLWFGKMTLDPISGAIVGGELGRREKQLFEADWSEAKERLGREPTIGDLRRTPGQRRADALVEMATRSASMAPGAKRLKPLFSVLVGYETLQGPICELAGGTVLAPGALLPWLDEAYVERVVFGPDKRVEVSKKTRLFKGATRRAVMIRDRQCTHDYCDRPGEECEVDHILPASFGGETTQEGGRLLCGYHNRRRHIHGP